jgi:hypothetical protein
MHSAAQARAPHGSASPKKRSRFPKQKSAAMHFRALFFVSSMVVGSMGTAVETRYWNTTDCTGMVSGAVNQTSGECVAHDFTWPQSNKFTCSADGNSVVKQVWNTTGDTDCAGDASSQELLQVKTCRVSPNGHNSEEVNCITDRY